MEIRSKMVRVKEEVEELVELASERLGLLPFTVRNTALLYGLPFVLARPPRDDEEFAELLEWVRRCLGQEREVRQA